MKVTLEMLDGMDMSEFRKWHLLSVIAEGKFNKKFRDYITMNYCSIDVAYEEDVVTILGLTEDEGNMELSIGEFVRWLANWEKHD